MTDPMLLGDRSRSKLACGSNCRAANWPPGVLPAAWPGPQTWQHPDAVAARCAPAADGSPRDLFLFSRLRGRSSSGARECRQECAIRPMRLHLASAPLLGARQPSSRQHGHPMHRTVVTHVAREHGYVTIVARYTVTPLHAMARLWRLPHQRRTRAKVRLCLASQRHSAGLPRFAAHAAANLPTLRSVTDRGVGDVVLASARLWHLPAPSTTGARAVKRRPCVAPAHFRDAAAALRGPWARRPALPAPHGWYSASPFAGLPPGAP